MTRGGRSMKKYCIHCQQETVYNIIQETVTAMVRGKTVSYISETAVCSNCSSRLYVPQIHDANLDRMDEAYKKQEDIITIEEINNILEMYHIGKRPLSRLLGFGEITVTRFLNGKLPSKKSSDILKSVLNSTSKMRKYVEKTTDDSLKSACEKVLKSIDELEQMKNAPKVEQISQYFLMNLEDTTNMAINKLLHFAQISNYMVYNKPLFDCESEAWIHGPVYPVIYQKYKKYKKDVITPIIKNDNLLNLDKREKELLDKVILNFGCYSSVTLRNMTHFENVWIDARKGLKDNEPSNEVIKLEELEKYAHQLKEILDIKSINDINKYSDYLKDCEYNNKLAVAQ